MKKSSIGELPVKIPLIDMVDGLVTGYLAKRCIYMRLNCTVHAATACGDRHNIINATCMYSLVSILHVGCRFSLVLASHWRCGHFEQPIAILGLAAAWTPQASRH
jgi:hypothetical protein